MKNKIAVIGATGKVGSKIVENIYPIYGEHLMLLGRGEQTLIALKNRSAKLASIVVFDLYHTKNDFSFLKEVSFLIVCVDIPNTDLIDACIQYKVHYLDISASQNVYQLLKSKAAEAILAGIKIVFGLGLAPGISNILAKELYNQKSKPIALSIYVLLGLGEAHGDEAFKWTFEQLDKQYYIKQNGKQKLVKSFTDHHFIDLLGEKKFYLFDFVDQHILADSLHTKSISTRLAFDNNVFNTLVGFMRKIGFTKLYKIKWIQKIMIALMKKVKLGTDVYGVKVIAQYQDGQDLAIQINGNNEGEMTALVASTILIDYMNTATLGLIFPHQIIDNIPLFFKKLEDKSNMTYTAIHSK